jgi:hypothetical protein
MMGWKPKMIDMANTPEKSDDEVKEDASLPDVSQPRYPYGLCLCLTDKELGKLGLDASVEVGATIHLFAMAKVTAVSSNETDSGKNSRVELQITSLGVENEDDENAEADASEAPADPKAKTLYQAKGSYA